MARVWRVIPWLTLLLVVVLTVASIQLAWLNRGTPDLPTSFGAKWSHALLSLMAGLVGALLVARTPRNPSGWTFLACGLFGAVNTTLDGYAGYALHTRSGSLPGGVAVAWVFNWFWIPLVSTVTVLFPLFFPDAQRCPPSDLHLAHERRFRGRPSPRAPS